MSKKKKREEDSLVYSSIRVVSKSLLETHSIESKCLGT